MANRQVRLDPDVAEIVAAHHAATGGSFSHAANSLLRAAQDRPPEPLPAPEPIADVVAPPTPSTPRAATGTISRPRSRLGGGLVALSRTIADR